MSLLVSPATANLSLPVPLPFGKLEMATDLFRRMFTCTVIDAPRLPVEAMGNLAGASLAALLVFQLNVPCVCQAQRMVKALTDRGVDSARTPARGQPPGQQEGDGLHGGRRASHRHLIRCRRPQRLRRRGPRPGPGADALPGRPALGACRDVTALAEQDTPTQTTQNENRRRVVLLKR